jgi:hypothetical protein
MVTGATLTERSTKLTAFACLDAKGTITYNGIGWDDDRKTPSEWIQDLNQATPFSTLRLEEVSERLRSDAETRIGRLSSAYRDRRHTYVLGVWHEGRTCIYTVSNYECASNENRAAQARPTFDVDIVTPTPDKNVLVIATGATRQIRLKDRKRIEDAARANKSTREIKNLCAKIVKDASYGKDRRGSVGSSVQWIVIGESSQDLFYGLDVPGGTTLDEVPNLIGLSASMNSEGGLSVVLGGQGISIKDAFIEHPAGRTKSLRYDPGLKRFRISETPCGDCGAKIPEGYNRCPICDSKE